MFAVIFEIILEVWQRNRLEIIDLQQNSVKYKRYIQNIKDTS